MEDVDGDGGQKCRRLIFLSNKNVVQSEARLFAGDYKHAYNLSGLVKNV